MATISYGFRGTNVILANGVTQGAQWAPAFASNPAGTRHVGVWTSNAAGTDVVGRLFAGINPQSAEFAVSAALPDGGFVVAYEDTGWGNGKDITARIYNADGAARTAGCTSTRRRTAETRPGTRATRNSPCFRAELSSSDGATATAFGCRPMTPSAPRSARTRSR